MSIANTILDKIGGTPLVKINHLPTVLTTTLVC